MNPIESLRIILLGSRARRRDTDEYKAQPVEVSSDGQLRVVGEIKTVPALTTTISGTVNAAITSPNFYPRGNQPLIALTSTDVLKAGLNEGVGGGLTPTVLVTYQDVTATTLTEGRQVTYLTSATQFQILDSPAGGTVRLVTAIHVCNRNLTKTHNVDVILEISGGNQYMFAFRMQVASSQTLALTGSGPVLLPTLQSDDFVKLAGRAGGQTVYGGTAAFESLVLRGTSNLNVGPVDLLHVLLSDAAADPTAAGRFQRSATKLLWHDGVAVRRLALYTNVDPTSGQLLVHNGTVFVPVSMSGDATMSSTGAVTLASSVISDYTNYLVNGDFIIHQRYGSTLATIPNETYSADRWRVTRENADVQGQQFSTSGTDGLTLTKITNTGKFVLYQMLGAGGTTDIERVIHSSIGGMASGLAGLTVTFQIYMRVSSGTSPKSMRMGVYRSTLSTDANPAAIVSAWNGDGTDPTFDTSMTLIGAETKSVTGTGGIFSITVTIPTTPHQLLYFMVWTDNQFGATNAIEFRGAGVYASSVVRSGTSIRPRHLALEWELCQRYYEKSFERSTAVAQNSGSTLGAAAYRAAIAGVLAQGAYVRYAVRKRIAVTPVLYNPSAANTNWRNSTAAADSGASSILDAGESGFYIGNAQAAGDAAGDRMTIHWSADAEL